MVKTSNLNIFSGNCVENIISCTVFSTKRVKRGAGGEIKNFNFRNLEDFSILKYKLFQIFKVKIVHWQSFFAKELITLPLKFKISSRNTSILDYVLCRRPSSSGVWCPTTSS